MSELAELQRAMARVCFDRAPRAEDVAALGGEPILLYRELVRSRIRDLVPIALPRSERAIGAARMGELVDGMLADAPPRSRYFREVIPSLVAYALPRLDGLARDVLRLESTRWEMGWRDGEIPGPIVELDLARVPVPHPTLRVLTLEHAVHRETEPPEPGTFRVCVHRRPDHKVETRTLDETGALLVEGWARADRPAIEVVREVLRAEGREPDPAFVDRMSALLAALLESGALLGSRG